MKKTLLLLFFLISTIGYGQNIKRSEFKLRVGLLTSDYLPGIIIIKFKPSANTSGRADNGAISTVKITDASIQTITKKFPEASSVNAFSDRKNSIGLDRIYELKYTGTASIELVINELLKDERVEYAEPSYIHRSRFTPNDPFLPNQNWLAQVRAPQAWDIIRNSSGVIIAIVDSGSELTHPDLVANIQLNTADPINGTDDDKDGYVDNYRGWDFVGTSANQITEDNDPSVKNDAGDHGIHVSGIASAVTNNSTGIASIAYNAKLLIVKAGSDNDGEAIYRGYDGIKYAADHGAQIINCSWGGEVGGAFGLDVINYAISKGCLVVAAAGNSGTSNPEYPAAYPGVLGVGNVNGTDVRNGSSNFGGHVSISAPGSGILSTIFNSTYGVKSGTSMAAPMVSSAAALVKSLFPTLTMQQVGEKLRATADNIDALNPGYIGLLGKGRLNVLRALTEFPPSIRNQNTTIVDAGNGSIAAGQTFSVYLDLKNFLSPVSSLQVNLSSSNPNIIVTGASQTVGSISTLETKTMIGPFQVLVKQGTPDNTLVAFRVNYLANGGSYQDFETFSITVSLDYLNINVNKVGTTLTSNGRVGFSSPDAVNGQGFSYLQRQLLYEASLMVGRSSLQVSNNARSDNSGSDEHFFKRVKANRIVTNSATFEGRSEFDDSNNLNKLNVYVKHRQLAWASAPDDKFTVAEYEVTNTSTTDLNNIFIGMFTDWDIDGGSSDVTRYDAANRIGYVQRKSGGSPIGAVKLLSTNGAPLYYPLSTSVNGDPLSDGSFTIPEKFQTLSSGIKATSLGDNSTNGYDVTFVSGYGPFSIPAKGSVTVAFAFIGGDDLNAVQRSAAAAQSKYDLIKPIDAPISASLELKQNYPNPFPTANSASTTVQYSIPQSGKVSLSVYNLMGQKVKTYVDGEMSAGVHIIVVPSFEYESGLYIYRIVFNNEEKALRMSVVKR